MIGGVPALAQVDPRVELAALRNDVLLLSQRVGELSMTVEQLTRENSTLQDKANRSYATVEQLNKAIADVNRALEGGLADQRRDILNQVAGQMERLGRQVNASLASLEKTQISRAATQAPVQTTFSDDFPKTGINYTVQAGDTLGGIARKNNAKLQDIINANKIGDPTRIIAGQTLFIPLQK